VEFPKLIYMFHSLFVYVFMCFILMGSFSYFPSPPFKFKNMSTLPCPLWAGNESEFHSVSPHPLQSKVLFPKSRGTKLNQTNNQTNKQTFSISTQKDLVWL